MAASCRFAFAVHILSVLALKAQKGVTSDVLAGSVNTNPVVIRRLLSTLQHAGLVATHKGAGGGSQLARPPEQISLSAIYRAIEPAPSFSPHPQEPNQRCPVGRKIEVVLTEVFASAQAALEDELARRTLADVLDTLAEDVPLSGKLRKKRALKPR